MTKEINPLSRTAIHLKTKEEYDEVMRIYDKLGWLWENDKEATKDNNWSFFKEKTCVTLGILDFSKVERKFEFKSIDSCNRIGWKVYTVAEFKKEYGLTT